MSPSHNAPQSSGATPAIEAMNGLQRIGPLLGGVVLGVGLTVLPLAMDRADWPSPMPDSLSWHQPDRLSAIRVNEHAAVAYVDMEVALVNDVLRGEVGEAQSAQILDYLSVRGSDASVRAWAASAQAPAPAAVFEVAPITWGGDLGESDETVYAAVAEEPVPSVPQLDESPVEAALPDLLGSWLALAEVPDVLKPEDDLPVIAPAPVPVIAPAPVPIPAPVTAPLPAPVAARAPAPAVADDSANDAVADAVLATLPREAAIANTRVFVDLTAGESDSVPPDVTARVGQLAQCYENSLQFDPDVAGSVSFEWNIRSGRVNAIEVSDDSLNDEIAVRCMSERIRRWRFEPDVSGMVAWRFAFDSHPG